MHPAGTRLVDGKPLEQEGQPAGPVPPVQVPDNLPRAVFSNNTFADDDGGGETKQVRWDMAPTRSPPTGTLTKATPAGTKHRRSQPIASRSPSGFNGSPYLPMRWEKRVEQFFDDMFDGGAARSKCRPWGAAAHMHPRLH